MSLTLPSSGQLVALMTRHLGKPIPSPALPERRHAYMVNLRAIIRPLHPQDKP